MLRLTLTYFSYSRPIIAVFVKLYTACLTTVFIHIYIHIYTHAHFSTRFSAFWRKVNFVKDCNLKNSRINFIKKHLTLITDWLRKYFFLSIDSSSLQLLLEKRILDLHVALDEGNIWIIALSFIYQFVCQLSGKTPAKEIFSKFIILQRVIFWGLTFGRRIARIYTFFWKW